MSSTTKTTSTTTSYKNGILEPRYSKPPTDLKDLRTRLARPRETASKVSYMFAPDISCFHDFLQ
ncbi:hypothetical protein F5Y03DRAFT_370414 [Xylaria venustula]|nr:hypothetical protein F5Y03DRAFT_370414 [Xylaria venustula]